MNTTELIKIFKDFSSTYFTIKKSNDKRIKAQTPGRAMWTFRYNDLDFYFSLVPYQHKNKIYLGLFNAVLEEECGVFYHTKNFHFSISGTKDMHEETIAALIRYVVSEAKEESERFLQKRQQKQKDQEHLKQTNNNRRELLELVNRLPEEDVTRLLEELKQKR